MCAHTYFMLRGHTCSSAHTHPHISMQQNIAQTVDECVFNHASAKRRHQIAVEDELVPDRDKKIIKSPKTQCGSDMVDLN